MKYLKSFLLLAVAVVFFTACEKDEVVPVPVAAPSDGGAMLKVVYASAYVIRDSIQIKINGVRVSNTFMGIGTAATALPTPFPGGGLNTGGSNFPYYLDVQAGRNHILVSVPKKLTTIDSIIRFSGAVDLEAGNKYSAYITDTLTNARVVLIKENLDSVPNGFSRFRFVNLIPNQPAIDLYFGTQLVAGNVAFGTSSPEFNLAAGTVGKWAIRIAGALPTATPIVTYPTGTTNMVIPNKRMMTVFSKGYTGGTVARIPTLHLLYN